MNKSHLLCLITCWLILTSQKGNAFLFDLDADLAIGYRQDRIAALLESFDDSDRFILDDRLKADNIPIYEVGLKGQVKILNGLMARGFVYFGSVYEGRHEDDAELSFGSEGSVGTSVCKGSSRDESVAVGYWINCIPFCNWIGGSPLVGWSFNSQRIKMKKSEADNLSFEMLEGLTYRATWEGPWVGLEARLCLLGLSLDAGYEYHWPDWRGGWEFNESDLVDSSYFDRRESCRGDGHVVYVNAHYAFCNGLDMGLGLKHQTWQAEKKAKHSVTSGFTSVAQSVVEVDEISKATWESFGVQLYLGYQF